MAAGAEIVKTFAAEATKNAAGYEGRQIGAADVIVPMQAMSEKKPAARPGLHRTTRNTADAENIATHTGITPVDVGNSAMVAVDCLFSVLGENAEVFLARFDAAGALLGISEIQTILADGTYTDGTSFVSERYIFDASGASTVAVIIKTPPATGTVSIRVVPL